MADIKTTILGAFALTGCGVIVFGIITAIVDFVLDLFRKVRR